MLRNALVVAVVFLTGCATQNTIQQQHIISWNTPEGVQRLSASKYKIDFFLLANHFESQSNKFFCGPTSATIVLNALRVRQPPFVLPEGVTTLNSQDRVYLPRKDGWTPFYKRYTQDNILILSPKPRAVVLGKPIGEKEGKPIKDYGFQLQQLADLFEAHQLVVDMHVVENSSGKKHLKKIMIDSLKRDSDYLIVNYQRSVLGQQKGGHISPIAAYHKLSDTFLILDTAPNKADWVWVNADSLINAMQTFDKIENRGFLIINEHVNNGIQ